MHTPTATKTTSDIYFVWLEITGKCQLECVHCYADSGPSGTHGRMSTSDWFRVIDEAADLGADMVQFIGGEPTLHPDLPALIDHALSVELDVEVFSNLVHITPRLWETFGRTGVRLACSYYSDEPSEHAAITGRNTHARTKANIAFAQSRAIPVRVGVVGLDDAQRTEPATAQLVDLGVTDIGHDRLRGVGRGVRGGDEGKQELCGNCTNGVLAVSPTGDVWPCVFSRWLPVGNVLDTSLAEITNGPTYAQVSSDLDAHFAERIPGPVQVPCVPQMCNPQCGPSCSPACMPRNNCGPAGACAPSYR